jgi:hypothetical protein
VQLGFERFVFRKSGTTQSRWQGHSSPCVILLLCSFGSAQAQQDQVSFFDPMAREGGPMFDPADGMIRLDLEIQDQFGNPVAGLSQRDFKLQDNGQPGKIVSFQAFDGANAAPNHPIEVILRIDELNMGRPPELLAAENEAESFLRQRTIRQSLFRKARRSTENLRLIRRPERFSV